MDKTEKLLRMIEHPELYSDEQLQELLSDEECRELYEVMRLSASAFEMVGGEAEVANGLKEEEWDKLEATLSPTRSQNYWTKIAAAVIGILMLSGITYAAIHIVGTRATKTQEQQTAQTAKTPVEAEAATTAENNEQQVLYENTELEKMLNEMAVYYHYEVIYQQESTRHLRIYFTWKKTLQMEEIVALLNKFEHIRITQRERVLIVE
ncbi:MAG: DUF4974 domain-containing protein [Prevotella sp.]|nr:DUF4974 domain-containing protein [Prevotella sp.]